MADSVSGLAWLTDVAPITWQLSQAREPKVNSPT